MTGSRIKEAAAILRSEMVGRLEKSRALRSPEWKAAALEVPRHVFLPAFYEDASGPDGMTRYTLKNQDNDCVRWLDLSYQDRTWVTQLDHGRTTPAESAVTGIPTSSSTLPSVVLGMLEDLDVEVGMKVLEVGTGTGYSTALLCEYLGDQNVTSVEYDAEISALAGERLASLGYRPRLVAGDGAAGCPEGRPFSRVIATYSPESVPVSWLEQAAPGAFILVSLVGSWDAYGYVRLEVESPDMAHGRFRNDGPSFMLSRKITRPVPGPLLRAAIAARAEARARTPVIDITLLNHSAFAWAAQLHLPGVIRLSLTNDGVTGYWFLHADGSWAVLESGEVGESRVYQGGPRSIWTELEAVGKQWLAIGRPGMERYGLTVTSGGNTVWLDDPANAVGVLGE
ncbi:methyltransferase domain-containing protein [Streptomyces sp. NPDC087294]|uniref:methyltransferase domain-containing protein n=1 Tax=Streptomyces sp. NPDC087294 TaxID=3365777 RepID=UPI0037FDBBF4